MPRPKGNLPLTGMRIVALIIDQGHAAAGKLDPDLMRPPGAKLNHNKRFSTSCSKDTIGEK